MLLMVGSMVACTGGKEHHEHDQQESVDACDQWIAMDDFHLIMAESFHPFKDSADVGPARKNAAILASAAAEWLASPMPDGIDSAKIATTLQLLRRKTEAFVDIAKNEDDATVGESLTAIHDVFHQLQEAWYANREEKMEDH